MGGKRKTSIMYKARLSHSQLKLYLALLDQNEMIVNNNGIYETTPKGLTFIREFESINFLFRSWIFFQAKSVSYALLLVRNLVQFNVQSDIYAPWGGITDNLGLEMTLSLGLIVLLAFVHFVRDQRLRLPSFMVKKAWVRWAAYLLLALAIMNLGVATETPFLYTTF